MSPKIWNFAVERHYVLQHNTALICELSLGMKNKLLSLEGVQKAEFRNIVLSMLDRRINKWASTTGGAAYQEKNQTLEGTCIRLIQRRDGTISARYGNKDFLLRNSSLRLYFEVPQPVYAGLEQQTVGDLIHGLEDPIEEARPIIEKVIGKKGTHMRLDPRPEQNLTYRDIFGDPKLRFSSQDETLVMAA